MGARGCNTLAFPLSLIDKITHRSHFNQFSRSGAARHKVSITQTMELQTMSSLPFDMAYSARPYRPAARAMALPRRRSPVSTGLWRALPLAFGISAGLWAMGAGIAIAALHHL
jgi:hypothetical protein